MSRLLHNGKALGVLRLDVRPRGFRKANLPLQMRYRSVVASLTPWAAYVAAKDRLSQTMTFGELTTCLRTPLAKTPYIVKMVKVIAMKTTLSSNSSTRGDEAFGEIASGRNAKKNRVSLGFKRLSKTAFTAICQEFFSGEAESKVSAPCSRHIAQAR